MSLPQSESRPVLGPAGNKSRSPERRKPVIKSKNNKIEKAQEISGEIKGKKSPALADTNSNSKLMPLILRKQQEHKVLRSNLSMNASCSSDASSDSSHSRASTGRIVRRSVPILRKPSLGKIQKVGVSDGASVEAASGGLSDGLMVKKRCAWVTPTTDPSYAAFHDEEWGVPVHDDRTLFELLSLSTALAELTWPAILNKRHMFRDVFQDFDPVKVAKLNEKRITTGSSASLLLSELKLRVIIENARRMCKIIQEFGSFDKYIWGFVNHKPTVSHFRYPRQVPIKTSKADFISKDLVKRGFQGVGPTVVYSFMQVAGITNDHLISCFRFQECIAAECPREKNDNGFKDNLQGKHTEDETDLGVTDAVDRLSLAHD